MDPSFTRLRHFFRIEPAVAPLSQSSAITSHRTIFIPYFLAKCQENRFVSPQGGRYQMSEMPFLFINSLPVRKSFLVCRYPLTMAFWWSME